MAPALLAVKGFIKMNPKITLMIIILVVIVVVYFAGKAKGSTGRPKRIRPGQLPDSGSGIPTDWLPSDLSDELYDVLTWGWGGYNWGIKSNEPIFRKLYLLPSDDMLAAVYWDYTNRYAGKNRKLPTMTHWIKDEKYVDETLFDTNNYKELLIQRLNSIGL